MDSTTAIKISEVSKAFGHGRDTLLALDRVSLDVALGEFVCLIGASGCGKSTLLSLVAGLDRGLPVLFVTHNVREAVRLGDRVVVLSSRPGRVIEEFPVPIPGPRRIDSTQVAQLAGRITDRLREEMGRHGEAQ